MNEDIKIKDILEIISIFQNGKNCNTTLNSMIGEKVIIRCYSAGNWFGKLIDKCKDEVILQNARRLHGWTCKKGISLSEIALYGLEENGSNNRICSPVERVWLQAIEIIPCTTCAAENIKNYPVYKDE